MPRLPVHFLLALVAILAMALAPRADAQQDTITVTASAPSRVYIGDSFELHIIIRGASNVPRPDLPPSPDYSAAYLGPVDLSSQSVIIINGQVTRQQSLGCAHKFALTPSRTGDIQIPALEVRIDGRPFTTRPLTVQVVEPARSGDVLLTLEPEKTRVYAGEPIRLRLRWLLAEEARGVAVRMPPLPGGVELLEAPDPRPRSPVPDTRFVQLPIDGEPAIAVLEQTEHEGRAVTSVTIDRILLAHRPGTFTFGPARIDYEAVIGRRRLGFMDSPFTDPAITERRAVAADPFTLEVLPLPAEGRPADFSGLVGEYDIIASADPLEASVGEPITLRVTVNGPPPLALVPPLDLSAQPALAEAFRVPREPLLPTITPVGAMFTAPVRPRSAENTRQQIPPITISYFNTATGRYDVARTPPINITVHPSTGVELPDLAEDEPREVAALRPSVRVDDHPLDLSGARFDFITTLRSPVGIAALAAPPALFASTWLALTIADRRRRDPAAARRRRAVRTAQRRLARLSPAAPAADLALGVSSAISNLAADWFNRAPSSLTGPETLTLLASAGEPTLHPLRTLLSDCDRVRFAPLTSSPSADAADLLARARASLADIAAVLKRTAQHPAPASPGRAPALAALLALAALALTLLATPARAEPQTPQPPAPSPADRYQQALTNLKTALDDAFRGRPVHSRLTSALADFDALLTDHADQLSNRDRARILYNRGLANLALGDPAAAILDLRRSDHLAPGRTTTARELAAARAAFRTANTPAASPTSASTPPPSVQPPEPREPLADLLWNAVRTIDPALRWTIGAGSLALAWLLLTLALPARLSPHRRPLIALAAVALTIGALPLASLFAEHALRPRFPSVVVTSESTTPRAGPDDLAYPPIPLDGRPTLPRGSELIVLETRALPGLDTSPTWLRVRPRTADNPTSAWIPAADAAPVAHAARP